MPASTMTLLITGGGTGGHLFPGIALGRAVQEKIPGSRVLFVGTDRKLDCNALNGLGFAIRTIRCGRLKGMGLRARFRSLLQLPVALFQAVGIHRRERPDLVFGVGGYVTGPVILAARLLGIPACIHEQNSVPGLTNRLLARLSTRIFISLPGSAAYFPPDKTVLSGNPIRGELLAAAAESISTGTSGTATLAVLGGSQGAHRVNELVLSAVKKYRRFLPEGLKIIHQTGEADENMVAEHYRRLGIDAGVAAFIRDMADVYRRADLVVCRAGATTLAELTVFGKPALLIPYPYAADNHQEKNGRYLVESGGALMFTESALDGERLGREIVRLLADGELLRKMGDRCRRLARPRATEIIVRQCLELIRSKNNV